MMGLKLVVASVGVIANIPIVRCGVVVSVRSAYKHSNVSCLSPSTQQNESRARGDVSGQALDVGRHIQISTFHNTMSARCADEHFWRV